MPLPHLVHSKGQVAPAHARPDPVWTLHSQKPLDVLCDPLRSCGRQGDPTGLRMPPAHPCEVQVVRAEGMTPLAYAMGLVDGNGADIHGPAGRFERRLCQPFRRDEKESTGPEPEIVQDALHFSATQSGPQGIGTDALLSQAIHLVAHQGDERTDDKADASAMEAGYLIADRFPAAGGQDGQCIATGRCREYDGNLRWPEGGEAPMGAQDGLQGGQRRTGCVDLGHLLANGGDAARSEVYLRPTNAGALPVQTTKRCS